MLYETQALADEAESQDIYDLPSNFTGYVAPGPAVWNE